MEYGIQLYSVRDVMPDDMEGTLQKLSEMGYSLVEFAGFFGKSAAQVKAMLAKYGLRVSGTHTQWTEVAENLAATAVYHREIGNQNLIVPGADLDSQEKIDAFVQMANTFQPLLAEQGIRFGYHNHSHEFLPNADGSMIYDQLVERTGLFLELDTFWAYAAGKDPVALMETLRERLIAIHIKDGYSDGRGMPLGLGTAPVAQVYQKAVTMGIPMVVESETLAPDGLSEAKICIDYLRAQE